MANKPSIETDFETVAAGLTASSDEAPKALARIQHFLEETEAQLAEERAALKHLAQRLNELRREERRRVAAEPIEDSVAGNLYFTPRCVK